MKKLAFICFALIPALALASTIEYISPTTGTITRAKVSTEKRLLVDPVAPTPFTCNLMNLAASLTQCVGVPAAGMRYYITGYVAQSTTATPSNYSIQSGTGTNCGTTTTAVMPAAGTSLRFVAPITTQPMSVVNLGFAPLAVTTDHAICVIGTATNTLNIQIFGYIAP